MNQQDVLATLAKVGAVITNDHFVYTSGKHGSVYVNKDAIYPYTHEISLLCLVLAERFKDEGVETVIAPEVGAIVLAQWTAHHLSQLTGRDVVFATYAERDERVVFKSEGRLNLTIGVESFTIDEDDEVIIRRPQFVIKRGYGNHVTGKRVLVTEDLLTTGGSAKKVVEAVRAKDGNVVGLGVLCNRGAVTLEAVGNPPRMEALVNTTLAMYEESDCPLCQAGVPINEEYGKGKDFLARRKSETI
jgi:orotate phosphoribosyltransferase